MNDLDHDDEELSDIQDDLVVWVRNQLKARRCCPSCMTTALIEAGLYLAKANGKLETVGESVAAYCEHNAGTKPRH